MKTLITTTLIIAFSIMYALSQDLSGVWHGFAKNPDNKEILFVFLFEKTKKSTKQLLRFQPLTFLVSNLRQPL